VIINGSSDNMVGQVTYYLDGGINMTGVRNTGNVLPFRDFAIWERVKFQFRGEATNVFNFVNMGQPGGR
jgi:hypothetical protein